MESEPGKTSDESTAHGNGAMDAAEQPAATPAAAADVAAAPEAVEGGEVGVETSSSADADAGGGTDDSAALATEGGEQLPPAAEQSEAGTAEEVGPPPATSRLKWYAVHTYSGHENKARLSLLERIKNADMQDKFGEVLIPTESVVEMVKGQRRTTTRKFYPGYMFVQMDLDDYSFHLVKNTPKITGFLGGNKPVPVKDEEIAGINRQMTEGAAKPKPRISFDEGENIRVTGGPFSNFTGIVEEVRPEKQKLRVLVSIFGRATPVELDFSQVEKTEG